MNIYKRKLISFELAKLLKENGFDIPVYYSYTYSTKSKSIKKTDILVHLVEKKVN
jgi:hypothetical protein